MWKLSKLLGVLAASMTLATVLGSGAAQAATSHQLIYHWSGSRPVAGEAWYNAGDHNLAKGRNSFTIKDRMCSDGWYPFVNYIIYYPSGEKFKEGKVYGVSCGERSESAWTGSSPAHRTIRWQGCKLSISYAYYECEGWKVDSAF